MSNNSRFLHLPLALAFCAIGLNACDENHGCMDTTADNFNFEAEKEDGSCIPARNKLIGTHDYYLVMISAYNNNGTALTDTTDSIGVMQITEANTDALDFVTNIDGQWVVKGSINRFDITIPYQTVADSIQLVSGTGLWMTEETDTVDMTLTWSTSWSIPNYSYTRTYQYYLHKR